MSNKKDINHRFFDQILRGLNQGNYWQTRYILTPTHGLSNETVGGIWDMKIQSKTNKAIIRFENGYGRDPHINIDLTRYPSEKNLHIPVSESVIRTAEILNNTLHYVGSALFFASITLDAYRLVISLKEDFQKQREAVDVLKCLNEILEEKRESVKESELNNESSKRIVYYYESLQKETRLLKCKIPCETIKTGSVIICSWLCGAGGALGGGWAGGYIGSAVGEYFGSHGQTLGAFAGTIFGSFSGGIYGGRKGCSAGENFGSFVLEKIYNEKYKNDPFVSQIVE